MSAKLVKRALDLAHDGAKIGPAPNPTIKKKKDKRVKKIMNKVDGTAGGHYEKNIKYLTHSLQSDKTGAQKVFEVISSQHVIRCSPSCGQASLSKFLPCHGQIRELLKKKSGLPQPSVADDDDFSDY